MTVPTLEGVSVIDRITSWDPTKSLVETSAKPTPVAAVVVTSTLTWIQAALAALPQDGTDVSISCILETITDRELRDLSQAKTPIETLRRDLNREAAKDTARVRKVGKSNYSRL